MNPVQAPRTFIPSDRRTTKFCTATNHQEWKVFLRSSQLISPRRGCVVVVDDTHCNLCTYSCSLDIVTNCNSSCVPYHTRRQTRRCYRRSRCPRHTATIQECIHDLLRDHTQPFQTRTPLIRQSSALITPEKVTEIQHRSKK